MLISTNNNHFFHHKQIASFFEGFIMVLGNDSTKMSFNKRFYLGGYVKNKEFIGNLENNCTCLPHKNFKINDNLIKLLC